MNRMHALTHSAKSYGHGIIFSKCFSSQTKYDVVVVGGGHAGCEAATASARMGLSTALVTHKISTIGEMSCNPSFGGIGKGHLMKEIDALDGVCGRIADKSGIHFRMLNKSKGPAVWGPRAQMDRGLYRKYMKEEILSTKNLSVIEAGVDDLILSEPIYVQDNKNPETTARCCGVILENGEKVHSNAVVLTTGTFLRGQINIGLETKPAGRMGDKPSIGLAKTIESLGFTMGRLKTGTPPRILGSTINLDVCRPYDADVPPDPFSYMNDKVSIAPDKQLQCYTSNTKPELHRIVLDTLDRNRHVMEEINGPRYCPSIESKVLKFQDTNYQVWIEPEGLDSDIIYLQGFSCTMPEDIQRKAVQQIDGFENAEISRLGYGVEYDYMDPRQISTSYETHKVQNLFFAGQINGTTGYEEAAAQGIMAGINAGLKVQNATSFTISRSAGYIGVLTDDLTTQGTNEPYRMFTTRAEFRLLLRADNADLRLTELAYKKAKCISEKRYQKLQSTENEIEKTKNILTGIHKTKHKWTEFMKFKSSVSREGKINAYRVLGGVLENQIEDFVQPIERETNKTFDRKILKRLWIESSYNRMLVLQNQQIHELRRDESIVIPQSINYGKLNLFKIEIREKLEKCRPQTIAAASRIQGMTPHSLIQLLHYVKQYSQ